MLVFKVPQKILASNIITGWFLVAYYLALDHALFDPSDTELLANLDNAAVFLVKMEKVSHLHL